MGAKYRKGSLLPQPPLSSVGSGTGENRCCAWLLQAARQPPLLRDPYLHLPPLPSGSDRARTYWGQEVTMATFHSLGGGGGGLGCGRQTRDPRSARPRGLVPLPWPHRLAVFCPGHLQRGLPCWRRRGSRQHCPCGSPPLLRDLCRMPPQNAKNG